MSISDYLDPEDDRQCWDCDQPGTHRGMVRKMSGSFWAWFCSDHHPANDGFSSTVHTFEVKASGEEQDKTIDKNTGSD